MPFNSFVSGHCQRDVDAGQELRQGVGGGGEDDSGAVGHQERRQARPKATPRRKGRLGHDLQHRPVSRSHARRNRFQIISEEK